MRKDIWIKWVQELNAIAQTGLTYSKDYYDIIRFERLQNLTAEITAQYTNISSDKLLELFQQDKGYATPKIDVRGAVFKDNKILMVREKADKLWSLPGGWADIGESAGEAIVKEIFEESGFKTRAIKLIALFDKAKHSHPPHLFYTYKTLFLCEIIGGEARISDETSEVDFFSIDNLPKLSLGRVVKEQIKICFKHYYNRELATEFD
ncbi:MAG: hypothetical protein K0R02_84 [Rickettsiaceae bacterium]|jgi:ADP-ribose pyrophosphatase YjhB (NUDIX family)|nr:hypothetical protein [Rickettsiaceae bacterium]